MNFCFSRYLLPSATTLYICFVKLSFVIFFTKQNFLFLHLLDSFRSYFYLISTPQLRHIFCTGNSINRVDSIFGSFSNISNSHIHTLYFYTLDNQTHASSPAFELNAVRFKIFIRYLGLIRVN